MLCELPAGGVDVQEVVGRCIQLMYIMYVHANAALPSCIDAVHPTSVCAYIGRLFLACDAGYWSTSASALQCNLCTQSLEVTCHAVHVPCCIAAAAAAAKGAVQFSGATL